MAGDEAGSAPVEDRPPIRMRGVAIAATVGFVVTGLVLFSVARRIAPDTEPGHTITDKAIAGSDGTFRLTVDARNGERDVAIDLSGGRVVSSPDSADIVARRFMLRAPHGAADLGDVPLEGAQAGEATEWVRDEESAGEVKNPALSAWYDYEHWAHQLTPKARTYAVRLASGGGVAYVRFVSYYCQPEGSGCLTFDYRLQ